MSSRTSFNFAKHQSFKTRPRSQDMRKTCAKSYSELFNKTSAKSYITVMKVSLKTVILRSTYLEEAE